MPKKKRAAENDEPADPDSLVRQVAGRYRSGDGRFEVEQSDSSWFLLDTQQTNEFGQELIHGPFHALKAVREAIPGARTITPLPRSRRRAPNPVRAKEPPPLPPPTWIDELPNDEAAKVRSLIRALEREGLSDAEALVRTDRKGQLPVVAARLIERRLQALVEDVPAEERQRARELIRRATEIMSSDGADVPRPLPRWALVEIDPDAVPPSRLVRIRG